MRVLEGWVHSFPESLFLGRVQEMRMHYLSALGFIRCQIKKKKKCYQVLATGTMGIKVGRDRF